MHYDFIPNCQSWIGTKAPYAVWKWRHHVRRGCHIAIDIRKWLTEFPCLLDPTFKAQKIDEMEKTPVENGERDSRLENLPRAVDDTGAIPKGTIDPVYEAKARVLNHAVSAW